jgi:non-haem dioxygenase in morphine synthesis N-terminal
LETQLVEFNSDLATLQKFLNTTIISFRLTGHIHPSSREKHTSPFKKIQQNCYAVFIVPNITNYTMAAAAVQNPPATLAYVQAPETSADLDWADLITLDLSKFDRPGGKEELAADLSRALEEIGFFYVKNHGLTSAEVDTQFALAKSVLLLSDEEKLPYRAALEQGDYNGWKPAGTRDLIPGVKDNFEIYNIPKFIPSHANRAHPEIVKQHWDEIERFSKHIHNHIVKKLLVIFALALGLEDHDYFVNRHRYEESSGDHLRYMKYYSRSEQENKKLGGVWLKG